MDEERLYHIRNIEERTSKMSGVPVFHGYNLGLSRMESKTP